MEEKEALSRFLVLSKICLGSRKSEISYRYIVRPSLVKDLHAKAQVWKIAQGGRITPEGELLTMPKWQILSN